MKNIFKKIIFTSLATLFILFTYSLVRPSKLFALNFSMSDSTVNYSIVNQENSNYSYKSIEERGFYKEIVNGKIIIEEEIFIYFGDKQFILPEYTYYPGYSPSGEISHYQADTIFEETRDELIPFVAIYFPSEIREQENSTLNVQYGVEAELVVYSINIDIDESIKNRILTKVSETITIETLDNLKIAFRSTEDAIIKPEKFQKQTSSENKKYVIQNDYDNYTNNKKFIRRYSDDYFGNYRLPGSNDITDDPIVELVPKELMFVQGEHFYIGKEYGFFIRVIPEIVNYIQTLTADVMIFDIISVLPSKSENTGTTKVEPLFQYKYICIDIESRNGNWDGFDSSLTSVVYPHLHYYAPEYFLRDIGFKHNLENPTRLNPGDPGYSVYDDYGAFIIQVRYNSNGVGLKSKNKSFGQDVVNLVAGYIPVVGKHIPIYEFVRDGYRGFREGEYGYEHFATHENNEVNISTFKSNHSLQVDEWGYLIKAQTTTVDPNSDKPRLIHVNGGYSESKYFVTWKDYTYYDLLQVKTSITAEVVRDDTSRYWFFGWVETGNVNEFASVTGTYEHSKYHRYDTEKDVQHNREVVITDGSVGKHNVFLFESKLSGLFKIKTKFSGNEQGDSMFVLHDTINGTSYSANDNTSTNDKNAYLDIFLLSGNTYIIESWNKDPLVTDGYIVEIDSREYIDPEDYGFENQYYFEEKSKSINTDLGNEVLTKRLRTGYITWNGKSYLTLSAKRKNAGIAYIEYHFNKYIEKLDYELALWSQDESLIKNSSIRLEAQNSTDEWITIKTFDVSEMSTDKDKLINYSSEINFKAKSIRFIIETNSVQNENNSGRMVIGRVKINRHTTNVHNHSYGAPYTPSGSHMGMSRHLSTCSCGDTKMMPCLGLYPGPDTPTYCYFCGQKMEGTLLTINSSLDKRLYFVTYEPFTDYYKYLGLVLSEGDYLSNIHNKREKFTNLYLR